jgi:hypothetical protein
MAIDQRDVSSTLRFMDDRALQQYAAMYKNDPYMREYWCVARRQHAADG